MVSPKIQIFETEDVVAFALTNYISELSAKSIAGHGSFSVALSSGTLINTMRVVPLDSSDSNFKLAYDGFLSKVPIPEFNIYPIKKDYHRKKQQKIGMGPEGHVGSMFCWLFQRFAKQKWVTYLTDSPKPPPQRITFTFPLINSSSEIAMVVTGGDAADAVKVAVGKHANDYYPLPAQKIAPEGTLTWFLDKEATSELC
nr:probable 6-phosphogluconolactonase 4, chloroplastic [Tanacetum cinerariifolium]